MKIAQEPKRKFLLAEGWRIHGVGSLGLTYWADPRRPAADPIPTNRSYTIAHRRKVDREYKALKLAGYTCFPGIGWRPRGHAYGKMTWAEAVAHMEASRQQSNWPGMRGSAETVGPKVGRK